MKKFYFLILICFFFPSNVVSEEIFFSLKKNKVNVRYGPSFESPVKYVYKKIHLPTKVCPVCKLEFNWRKKWKKDWEQVIYCSEKCKRSKNSS